MTESDARWNGWVGHGMGWGGVDHGTSVHCKAGLGRVGYNICLVREFSICLVGVGWEWGSGR